MSSSGPGLSRPPVAKRLPSAESRLVKAGTARVNWKGCGTALVTPFTKDGALDEPALRKLVDWQIKQGIHFLVPCGSTGEAATMTPAEHRRVVEITVEQAKGRVPIVAGAGSNDTEKAVTMSKEMKAAGATHLLHVSPMYNKPPQRGIVEHFKRIAGATDLPIIVYNVPGRTGCNIEPATVVRLASLPHVIGIKEASANLKQIGEIIRDAPPDFRVWSGNDGDILTILALGGYGVVSVAAHLVGQQIADLLHAFTEGETARAAEIHHRLMPLRQHSRQRPKSR